MELRAEPDSEEGNVASDSSRHVSDLRVIESLPAATADQPPLLGSLEEEIAGLRVLLRGESTPQLAARIAAARCRWPDDLQLRLFEGALLEKAGSLEEAETCFRRALAAHPDNPWAGVRLMELLLRQRRHEEAGGTFAAAVWPAALPDELRGQLLTRIRTAFIDLSRRRDFLDGLRQGTAIDRFLLLKLAALNFREQNRSEAQRLFDAAKMLGALPLESQMLELDLYITASRFEEAFALAMELQERHPERPDFARRAIQAAHFSGHALEMVALLRRSLARWPGDWIVAFRYNRCTMPIAADRELFELLARQAAGGVANDRWLFQFAVACLRHQKTCRAMTILAQFSADSAVASMAGPLHAALSSYPASTWANPRDVDNDPERDVQIVRVPGAVATVIVLAGVQGGLNYLPFSHTDGLVARHRVNAVYLRDLNNRGFTAGVRSLGPDLAAMITCLKSLAAELAVPAVTIGASLGGIAAMRTAALMGAHAAISFAGPVQNTAAAGEGDTRSPGVKGARGALFSSLTQADGSLVEMVRAAPRTVFRHCFGAGYAPDVAAAELLRPLPNVLLHPVAGCIDHFVVEYMLANHEFDEVLEQMTQISAEAA